MPYAAGTSVPVERSQVELERMLLAKGARSFYRGFDGDKAVIGFTIQDRHVKFELPLPTPADVQVRRGGRVVANAKLDQMARERWRALVLCVKAKLTSVEAGVETFEQAFMAHVLLPNRQTVYEWINAQGGIASGHLPPLLPGAGETTGAGR